jgi:hypothetical protein
MRSSVMGLKEIESQEVNFFVCINICNSIVIPYLYSILQGRRPSFWASSSVTLKIRVEQRDNPLQSGALW